MRETFEKVPEGFISKTATYDQKVPIVSILEEVDRLGTVVITRGGEYAGVVDQSAIARKGSLKLEAKFSCGKFAKKVPVLSPETSISDAIAYFYEAESSALPYLRGSRIVGVVQRASVLKAILSMHLLSVEKVRSIMSSPVITIDSEASMAQAQKVMAEKGVHKLVVTSAGRLYGLLTHRDIVRYGARSEAGSRSMLSTAPPVIRVADICGRDPESISRDEGAESALRQLIERSAPSIIVLNGARPVGMVSARDILGSAAGRKSGESEKILISGLTPKTEGYRSDLIASLSQLSARIDRFAGMEVEYLTLNVKEVKSSTYELKVRMELEGRGAIHLSVTGHTLERTLRDLEVKLYKLVRERKEKRVASAREAEPGYPDEEA